MAVWACRTLDSMTAWDSVTAWDSMTAWGGVWGACRRSQGRGVLVVLVCIWWTLGGALGAVWGRVRLDRCADSRTGADSVRGWTA